MNCITLYSNRPDKIKNRKLNDNESHESYQRSQTCRIKEESKEVENNVEVQQNVNIENQEEN